MYNSLRVPVAGWSPKTLIGVSTLNFLPDDSLLVGTSAGSPGSVTVYDQTGAIKAGPQMLGNGDLPISASIYR